MRANKLCAGAFSLRYHLESSPAQVRSCTPQRHRRVPIRNASGERRAEMRAPHGEAELGFPAPFEHFWALYAVYVGGALYAPGCRHPKRLRDNELRVYAEKLYSPKGVSM